MGSSASYDRAKSQAEKILGKDAKIPDLPPAFDKSVEGWTKSLSEFDKAREDLEAKLLDLQNSQDGLKNGCKQFLAKLEKEDFGLDEKKKEDAKKIKDARKLLMDAVSAGAKHNEQSNKELDQLDKHVVQLGKFKMNKPSF